MSNNRWKNIQNMVYTHNGMVFSLTKEGNPAISNNLDKHGGNYIKGNKPVTGRHIHHNSYLYEIFKRASLIEAKNWIVVVREWGEGETEVAIHWEWIFIYAKWINLRHL